jgi:tetratricopeptide (TPR) repeat protein
MTTPKHQKKKQQASVGSSIAAKPWFWAAIIAAVGLFLYAGTLKFPLTYLDDSILIEENYLFNKDISNLGHAFQRGVFSEKDDTYYRPLLLQSFIIDNQLWDLQLRGYRLTNLFLHLLSGVLVFYLFLALRIGRETAFFLAGLFVVHPAISQAVCWVPGRNDSILAVFVLLQVLSAIRYVQTGQIKWLLWQSLAYLACLFTKETGIIAAVGAAGILLVWFEGWSQKKRMAALAGAWLGVTLLWAVIRSQATLAKGEVTPGDMASAVGERLPLVWQYFGKAIFPFNLSVFPNQYDTVHYWGLAALAVVGALVLLAGRLHWRYAAAGFAWFLLFLLPALAVPKTLNDEAYEHRLYLPMIGLLLMVAHSLVVRNPLKPIQKYALWGALVVVMAVLNLRHQPVFNGDIAFWENAVANSPSAANAQILMAIRYQKAKKNDKMGPHVKEAYRLNPEEKYVNHYMGLEAFDKKDFATAEQFFLKELQYTDLADTHYFLANARFQLNNKAGAIESLETFLTKVPKEQAVHNNLLLLYREVGDTVKLREHVTQMRLQGLVVPEGF